MMKEEKDETQKSNQVSLIFSHSFITRRRQISKVRHICTFDRSDRHRYKPWWGSRETIIHRQISGTRTWGKLGVERTVEHEVAHQQETMRQDLRRRHWLVCSTVVSGRRLIHWIDRRRHAEREQLELCTVL